MINENKLRCGERMERFGELRHRREAGRVSALEISESKPAWLAIECVHKVKRDSTRAAADCIVWLGDGGIVRPHPAIRGAGGGKSGNHGLLFGRFIDRR